jgi:hypothetical protein
MGEAMDFKLGNLCHIEIPCTYIPATKEFYGKLFNWTFSPMNETYEFFDAGNSWGAFDTDAKPSGEGTILVLACDDVEAKLKEIGQAGGEVVQPKTEIAEGHGWYGYFKDPSGNRLGVWQPAKAKS